LASDRRIALEESGEKYEARRLDLSKGEQKAQDYLKIHPLGRVR
jgi:glutathione S-transferase